MAKRLAKEKERYLAAPENSTPGRLKPSQAESHCLLTPVVFIVGVQPRVVLVKGPYGPPLNPVFDVFSLNEPQKKRCSLHWDINLIRTYIGQAVEVEFIHKGVSFAAGPIEYSWGIPS